MQIRGASKHESFRPAGNCIDGSQGASHAYEGGIEILFETEFDPAVKWAIRAFAHDALESNDGHLPVSMVLSILIRKADEGGGTMNPPPAVQAKGQSYKFSAARAQEESVVDPLTSHSTD